MSNQKTNSVLVFVAVLVAAIIVIYAIMSNKPKTQPPVDGTVPAEAAGDPAGGEGSDTGAQPDDDVTRIDQTTDTTHGEVPAGGEADDQTGEVPAAAPDEEAPAAPSTLIEAAQAGDLPVLSAMIDSGMNVNATDDGGRTPLMHAAAGGHLDSVFALLNAGANAALRDNARRAARDYALARADEPGQTIARILEDAVGPPPVRDAGEK